jgi:CubicO group peptidase (beta-lactamase class C family)
MDKLQDILHLKTPGGGAPKSPQFTNITIRHLLEHTSGLNANAFNDDIGILNAFKTAQPAGSWQLPVSADMRDSFVASLDRVSDPGTAQAYNTCGYYLLGRVLAKKRHRSTPIDALTDFLFSPLHISRIRRGTSLIAATPADEARYRADDIPVLQSVMTNGRPLVPQGYGNEQYEDKEGSGGLSAATPDLASLIAILLSPNNSPALQRTTIQQMLDNAVANQAAWSGKSPDLRAGHGFDRTVSQGNGRYYGQKGGSLNTSGNVLEINGDWGFAMCWGGVASPATNWYPDYPAVMDIARKVAWGSTDLFPSFGMPSL